MKTPAAILLMGLSAGVASATQISSFDRQEYEVAITTPTWAKPPSDHHRLLLDVYNVTGRF
jgi:hypothetical protein